jgi:hypothetical protein
MDQYFLEKAVDYVLIDFKFFLGYLFTIWAMGGCFDGEE